MKKILMVSFVTLLAGVGSGHAAIPSTDYVDQGLETKVDDTQIVAKAGDAELATYAAGVQAGTVNVDSAQNNNIANVNAVAANFVPSAPTAFVDDYKGFEETNLVPGQYVMTVIVNSDGTKKYEWQAMQLWESSSTQYD